ncbi:MAG: hypothetical protein NTX25_02880 [Proteobacteria bacterium]|nr:hypothetical protein [Pseudomonadota bacterium]
MRFVLVWISLCFVMACQSTHNNDSWSFDIEGVKVEEKAMPWAFHQAIFELEYAKRVSENIVVNQFLGEALDLAASEGQNSDLKVEKPSEEQLQKFYHEMSKFLPPDYASNINLIEEAYVKWKRSFLKKKLVKKLQEQGDIKIHGPELKPKKFNLPLPELPHKGSLKPRIEILVVSVLDCDICLERNKFMEQLFSEFSKKTEISFAVMDSYPGDTSLPHYELMRSLMCARTTEAYWKLREVIFAEADTKSIEAIVPSSDREKFLVCKASNEPERVLARNNDLANSLYSKNTFSIYINQEKIAFPTVEIIRSKLEELSR